MRTNPLIVLAIALGVAGCASDAECPPGFELNGVCVEVAGGAGGSGGTGGSAGDGDGDGDGDMDDDAGPAGDGDGDGDGGNNACALEPEFEGGFESPCTDAVNHSECTCQADYCALMPGTEEGFCTVTGCLEDPGKCPDGWTCFDLSFLDGLSFCNPP